MPSLKQKVLDTLRLIWKLGLFEKMLVDLTKGKVFGLPVTKFPPNHYQYSEGTIRRCERDGINYELDLSDMVDWYIYFGFREPSREKLYELVEEGNVVFDVGANVGDVAMHAAKRVGDRGKIYAFEPDQTNIGRITKNLEQNSFDNIVLNKVGLGDEEGSFSLYSVEPGNRGMNRILPSEDGVSESSYIQVTTMDRYVEEHKIDSINLIKIDVEGYEFKVLKGGISTLKRFSPLLFIELDDRNLRYQGSCAAKLVSFLIENGYEVWRADGDDRVEVGMDFTECHFDIIARPLGKGGNHEV